MENASKALIMAASVLIGVLMLMVLIGFYISFGDFARNHDYKVDQQRIQQFNVQFTKYEGRDDLTAQDIVTVANLAREWNEMGGTPRITVRTNVSSYTNMENKNKDEMNEFLTKNSYSVSNNNYIRYTCDSISYEDDNKNNRVTGITFTKN